MISWMAMIFKFSNEPADTSQNTSLRATKILVDIFNKNIEPEKENELIEKYDPLVRKLAHFTLYIIGGISIINFVNTYSLEEKKKLVYSVSIGAIYACTDEFHQLFVEGRSGQFTDIMIDSLGCTTGVCVFLCVKKILEELIWKKSNIL